jgi:hypothetical protein
MHKLLLAFIAVLCTTVSIPAQGSLVFPPYKHSYGIRKATPRHLFMFFGASTAFDDPQGLATVKMESRDDTASANDDDEVVVYGVNSGRHQLIYNTSMWGLALYGSKGSAKDQFLSPKGVACDAAGHVFVADWGNNRVVHLFNPKKKVAWVGSFNGVTGMTLNGPQQVGVDEGGHVYVSDAGNRRIVVFSYEGKVVRTIPADTSFAFTDGPTTLAVADGDNRWSYFRNEQFIFCADSNGRRLWKIDFEGRVQTTVNVPAGFTAAYGATDYYHNFLITDTRNGCILKFDHNLALVDTFGTTGEEDNQFIEPRGIAIYKRYGQTFVAEKSGAQYYWVGSRLRNGVLMADDKGGKFALTTDLVEYSYLSLRLINGRDTLHLFDKRMVYPGLRQTYFMNAKPADPLKGTMELKIEPTYSSYTYNSWSYPIKVTAGHGGK